MLNRKILNFQQLKEEAEDYGQEAVRLVRRHFDNFIRNHNPGDRSAWRVLLNPWGEVKRLRAHIWAMREHDTLAARNVLDLYAENELLRRYKSLADGEMHQFVAVDNHKALQKEHKRVKEKLARVSQSLNDFQKEWEDSIGTKGRGA